MWKKEIIFESLEVEGYEFYLRQQLNNFAATLVDYDISVLILVYDIGYLSYVSYFQ